jgi:hypothetical protein
MFTISIKDGDNSIKIYVPPLTVQKLTQIYKSFHLHAKGFQVFAISEINNDAWIFPEDGIFDCKLLKENGIYEVHLGII